MRLKPNPGKKLTVNINNKNFQRIPIKTHLISKKNNPAEIIKQYLIKDIKPNDIVVISERIIAIMQQRSYLIKDIIPSWWAKVLYPFVSKHPGGIGLRSPWTMELAIREAGLVRILLASIISGLLKPFGVKGVFYYLAGNNINAIDGPCKYSLPPSNKSAKLGPKNPKKVVQDLENEFKTGFVIIDANDYGLVIMAQSKKAKKANLPIKQIFADNPMGQADEQTPIIILRQS